MELRPKGSTGACTPVGVFHIPTCRFHGARMTPNNAPYRLIVMAYAPSRRWGRACPLPLVGVTCRDTSGHQRSCASTSTWPLRSYRFSTALCARQYGLSSCAGCVVPCVGGRVGGCAGAWTLSHCEACSTCALTLAKSTPRKVTMTSWPCRVAFSVMLTGASGRGTVRLPQPGAGRRLAVAGSWRCRSGKPSPGQLLCTSGNRSTQPMFAETVWRLGEILTVAVAVDYVVGCVVPLDCDGNLGRAIGL